jgi:hypothetical protein
MTSTTPPFDRYDAHDALFDQIERELAALVHAPLVAVEPPGAGPNRPVDEFSNDFLNWSMPPRR